MGVWLLLCCQLWLLQIILLLCQVVSPNRNLDVLSGIYSAFRSARWLNEPYISLRVRSKRKPKYSKLFEPNISRIFTINYQMFFLAHPG